MSNITMHVRGAHFTPFTGKAYRLDGSEILPPQNDHNAHQPDDESGNTDSMSYLDFGIRSIGGSLGSIALFAGFGAEIRAAAYYFSPLGCTVLPCIGCLTAGILLGLPATIRENFLNKITDNDEEVALATMILTLNLGMFALGIIPSMTALVYVCASLAIGAGVGKAIGAYQARQLPRAD